MGRPISAAMHAPAAAGGGGATRCAHQPSSGQCCCAGRGQGVSVSLGQGSVTPTAGDLADLTDVLTYHAPVCRRTGRQQSLPARHCSACGNLVPAGACPPPSHSGAVGAVVQAVAHDMARPGGHGSHCGCHGCSSSSVWVRAEAGREVDDPRMGAGSAELSSRARVQRCSNCRPRVRSVLMNHISLPDLLSTPARLASLCSSVRSVLAPHTDPHTPQKI